MTQETWKEFEQNLVSHSNAHYLMAIHTLLKERGYARAIDIAKYLDLTRGSVSIALSKIREKGYILEDENKFYNLSESGEDVVNLVLSQRRTIIRFFVDVLGMPWERAEIDACKIEHLLSHETGEKLLSFLGFYLSDARESKKFRNAFENYTHACNHQSECKVCETACYFAGKEIKEI